MTALKHNVLQDLALVLVAFGLVVAALQESSNELDRFILTGLVSAGAAIAIGFAVGLYSLFRLPFGALLRRCAFAAIICVLFVLVASAIDDHLAGATLAAWTIAAGLAGMAVSRLTAQAFRKTDEPIPVLVVSPVPVLKPLGRTSLFSPSRTLACEAVPVSANGTVSDAGLEKIDGFARTEGAQRNIVLSGGVTIEPALSNALLSATRRGCRVTTLAGFLGDRCAQLSLEDPDTVRVLMNRPARQSPVRAGIGHAFGFIGSLSLLLIAALPMALISVLVRAQDGGPVFYRQDRVGLDGRVFTMLKFRTMTTTAEADGKAKWAEKKDPRVTGIGAILRAHRLDELPQLINILRGEMSLVGPRPERPGIVDDLRQAIPLYDYRHCVRPGITGWAQINFPYGASLEDAAEKTRYDLYFVQNCGFFLRLLVILQTVRVVIMVEGAR